MSGGWADEQAAGGGEWFATFFDAVANDLWDAALPPETTAAEAEYLRRVLELGEGSTVLDVPCGRGRHALALARAGVGVIGVDISADAVETLRQRAAAEGLAVDASVGDMREVEAGPVDAAYSMGNSIGYFDPGGVGRFFAAVAAAVRPGGRFVAESFMAAEAILPHLELESTYEAGGITMTDRNRYDARNSRVETTVTFERAGTVDTREMCHWVLTSGELVRLLEGAGFEVESLEGDVDRTPFTLGSSRLLAVCRRR